MLVDVKVKTTTQIDIEPDEAFRVLCKTLNMEFVLDEDTDFRVIKPEDGELYVSRFYNDGSDERYDDRGDLFLALRNVAVNIFPNVLFR